MKKFLTYLLLVPIFMSGAFLTLDRAYADTGTSVLQIRDLINLLIKIGIISQDKIPAANIFLASLNLGGITTTPTAISTVKVAVHHGGGGGGGGGSSHAVTYTLTYNGNGNTGGVAPSDSNKYSSDYHVTVLDNTGALTKTGYAFIGWNTQADGAGTDRATSSTFVMGASNLTLYAKWSPYFAGGDGSVGDPYQISNWAQLDNIRKFLSSNYIMTANLSSTTVGYSGLGDDWVTIGDDRIGHYSQFTGNFYGNSKIISDLVVNLEEDNVGLFGITTGDIFEIGLLNANINGADQVGGLVGTQASGTISNSYVTGNVTGLSCIGGLVGTQATGTISDSFSNVTVSEGSSSVDAGMGGLVGRQLGVNTSIDNSYSVGSIVDNGSGSNIAGFIGEIRGVVTHSYSAGNLPIYDSNLNCFYGVNHGGTISNSFCDVQSSGPGGKGLGTTTLAMKTIDTYAGWDIATSTTNLNNGYPYLGWQAGGPSHTWYIFRPRVVYTLNGSPTLSKSAIPMTASSTFLASFTFDVAAEGDDVSVATTTAFVVGVYVNGVEVATTSASYNKPLTGVTQVGSGPYVIADGDTASFTANASFIGPQGPYNPPGGIVSARLESATTLLGSNLSIDTSISDTFRTSSQTL